MKAYSTSLFSVIKANACSIIIAHNHPSGNLVASRTDIDLTRKNKEDACFRNTSVESFDSYSAGYYSFANEGLL